MFQSADSNATDPREHERPDRLVAGSDHLSAHANRRTNTSPPQHNVSLPRLMSVFKAGRMLGHWGNQPNKRCVVRNLKLTVLEAPSWDLETLVKLEKVDRREENDQDRFLEGIPSGIDSQKPVPVLVYDL